MNVLTVSIRVDDPEQALNVLRQLTDLGEIEQFKLKQYVTFTRVGGGA